MKRLLPLISFLIIGGMAFAKPVDKSVAARIASNMLQKSVVDATPAQFAECYLFVGADGEGFVLLSADDCVWPLLGYSHTSAFAVEGMPANIEAWIDGYQGEIASVKAAGIPQSAAVAEEWYRLMAGTGRETKAAVVGPLLETRWSQSPVYNDWCPYDSVNGGRSVTGCSATATSQVMRYWRHPMQGRGSFSYDAGRHGVLAVNYDTSFYEWDSMPQVVNQFCTPGQRRATAKLCYEVGVAMHMEYSAVGSGAYEHSGGMLSRYSTELALKKYFSYNPAMFYAQKQGYTDDEWVELLSGELDEGHPLIYSGTGGDNVHAFVVDGYDSYGFFHVNWGWGGICDGYFNIRHLVIQASSYMNYTPYNEMNDALIHMYPITPNDSVSTVTLVSADTSMGTVSGCGTYDVSSDRVFLRAHPKPGYRFSHWASGNLANPIFYYPTLDYVDTAYFVPLSVDTLSYCMNVVPNFDTVFTLAHAEWGIRIPESRLTAGSQLKAVENFVYTSGPYLLRIYLGEEPVTPVYEDTLQLVRRGWRTTVLDNPIDLDATQPLWITFSTEGMLYTQAISPFTGVDDGSWVKSDSGWQYVDTLTTGYYTWAIRGLLHTNAGIVEATGDDIIYRLQGRTLVVENPEGRSVTLYDIMGRPLATLRSERPTFVAPAAGVYLLKIGNITKKIVIL